MTEPPPMYLNQFGPQKRNDLRQVWLLVAAAIAVLLIVGAVAVGLALRSDNGTSAANPNASPSVFAVPKRFDTPQALVTYLDSRGHTCSRFETVQGATRAVARGRCYVGATEVTIGVYAIHSDAEAQWQLIAGTMKGISPVYMVIGENWTIGGPEAWARQVADTMGAEFRAQP